MQLVGRVLAPIVSDRFRNISHIPSQITCGVCGNFFIRLKDCGDIVPLPGLYVFSTVGVCDVDIDLIGWCGLWGRRTYCC